MKLLKTKRSWGRWKKKETSQGDEVATPKDFPCYVYMTVLSFGYEECRANYLYLNEVTKMKNQLDALILHDLIG